MATADHPFTVPTEVSSVHVAPESVDVHRLPPSPPRTAAVCLVPSADMATAYQSCGAPTEASSIHVPPPLQGPMAHKSSKPRRRVLSGGAEISLAGFEGRRCFAVIGAA